MLVYWPDTVKKLLILAASVLSAAFLVSAGLSVAFLTGLEEVWAQDSVAQSRGRVVAVLLPAERDGFWDELTAALHRVGGRDLDFQVSRLTTGVASTAERLERTSFSLVDGMLCTVPDGLDLTSVVDGAEGRGVPVLLLENDLPSSHRRAFLGVSSYQTGQLIAALIRDRVPNYRRPGVLLSQAAADRQTVKSSLLLNGLNEGLSVGGRSFGLTEMISPPGRFAGEELVWSLLRREPAVDVLVTTDPKDSSSALQAVVEANKVGKVRLVGVGEDQGLRAAIGQGLLTGLVVRDADEWASVIAGTFRDVFAGRSISAYVNLPVHGLTSAGEVHVH